MLHVSWDQHGESLRYARSLTGGGLVLSDPLPMTGRDEEEVTYPQFYELPGGDLLFLYRDGASGDGDVMLNRYSVTDGSWRPLHHPLIDGEGRRNAYVNQLAMDEAGGWHLSWTWRESWDVASNHDILYAYSRDEGESWQRSTGEPYDLPITESNAEVAVAVPQGRGLINQTTTAVGSPWPFPPIPPGTSGGSASSTPQLWASGSRSGTRGSGRGTDGSISWCSGWVRERPKAWRRSRRNPSGSSSGSRTRPRRVDGRRSASSHAPGRAHLRRVPAAGGGRQVAEPLSYVGPGL